MEEITFGGKLTFEDYKTFNMYHLTKRYMKKLLILFCAYTMILYGTFKDELYEVGGLPLIILISVVISILTVVVLVLISLKRTKTIYNSSSRMKLEHRFLVRDEGVLCKNENGESIVKWDEIIAVIEKKYMILLYTSTIQAVIIPKRFFVSECDKIEFKKIVLEKVDNKKLKLMA